MKRFKIQHPEQNMAFWEHKAEHKLGYLRHLAHRSYARESARVKIAEFIKAGARSIIEVGVGSCNERKILDPVLIEYGVKYTGLDIADGFLDKGRKRFPNDTWVRADITTAQPMQADIVYSQHVLEHCPALSPALDWMLLSARVAVIYIFFIRPGDREIISRRHKGWLFANQYYRKDIWKVCEDIGFRCDMSNLDNRSLSLGRHAQNDETLLIAERMPTC